MDTSKNINLDWIMDRWGPILTTQQVATLLHRTPNAIRKSSCDRKSPLFGAKIHVGKRCYFKASSLAALLNGVVS